MEENILIPIKKNVDEKQTLRMQLLLTNKEVEELQKQMKQMRDTVAKIHSVEVKHASF